MQPDVRLSAIAGLLAILLAPASVCQAGNPQNIILFIGDGMGLNHVQAASLQKAVEEGKSPVTCRLSFEEFPVTGYLTTHSANSIVTDSAAAGTALACGVKTGNGTIGRNADGKDVDSIATLAKQKGRAVGIVTSVCMDDATPSVFYAHAGSRKETDNILEQAFSSKTFDVLMGGGVLCRGWDDGKLASKCREAGMFYLNSAGLASVTPEATAGRRVLGFFDVDGNHILGDSEKEKQTVREPRLSDLSLKALEILVSRSAGKGFFLMVEGGAIDKYAHANMTSGMVGEVQALAGAVEGATAFLREKGLLEKTLIVVTADHETGGFVLAEHSILGGKVKGRSKSAKPDGSAINMPSPLEANELKSGWTVRLHTCTWVPLFATGPESSRFAGRHDNTDVARIIAALL